MFKPEIADRNYRLGQLGLLGLAALLRGVLILRGGAGYWPDEARYTVAHEALYRFSHGEADAGWAALLGGADHILFKFAALLPAWAERAWGWPVATGVGFFAMFSVLSLWLVGRLARAAGGSEREAFVAVFFATGASSLFYFSRHLFPYDLGLFFCLGSLWFALRSRGPLDSAAAGLAASLGFLSYNGYWAMGAVILTWHVVSARPLGLGVRRALAAGAGLALPLLLLTGAARLHGIDLVKSFQEFSRTINQGDFGLGYRFVWEYLWSAEGGLLAVWLALVAFGAWRGADDPGRQRFRLWLVLAAAVYAVLVVFSDGLERFVIYGRIARLLVPFLCLAAAWTVERRLASPPSPRWLRLAAPALVAVLAAWQMAGPIRQVFPEGFLAEARIRVREERATAPVFLRVLNTDALRDGLPAGEPRPHATLLRSRHPFEFRPYLYEGIPAARRALLRGADISMRLVALPLESLGAGLGGPYPGPLRMKVRFPRGRAGIAEPLLVSGEAGAANFLYVHYLNERQLRFGFDAWGAGGPQGEPVEIDYDREHELMLFAGANLAPGPVAGVDGAPLRRLRQYVFVSIDGRVVLVGPTVMHPVAPGTFSIGANFAGGSTTRADFTGAILSAEPFEPAAVLQLGPALGTSAWRGPEWQGYPGPFRLRLRVKPDFGGSEPLVTTGVSGRGDLLFLERNADGTLRVGWDHWGVGATYSGSFELPADGGLELTLSSPALFPPLGEGALQPPNGRGLQDRLEVWANGRHVLSRPAVFYPGAAEDVQIGANLIGAASKPALNQVIEAAEPVTLESLVAAIASVSRASGARGPEWQGYPGPVRVRLRLGPDGGGRGEPVIVTGVTGAGDIIFLRRVDARQVVVGLDHWGAGGPVSAPLALEDTREVELVISHDGLLPPSAPGAAGEWEALRGWTVVTAGGRTLLAHRGRAHPSESAQIFVGSNPLGGSTSEAALAGEVLSVEAVAPAEILPAIAGAGVP